MRIRTLLLLASTLVLISGCDEIPPPAGQKMGSEKKNCKFEKSEVTIKNGVFTPEVLWSLGRLGEIAVSPNGETVAYTVTWFDQKANQSWNEIHMMSVKNGESEQVTELFSHCHNLEWNGNTKLRFISNHEDIPQIYQIERNEQGITKLSNIEGGLDGFKTSPDGDRILYTQRVKVQKSTADIYPDLPEASGVIYNDLMYRHWDHWDDGFRSHIFIARLQGGLVGDGIDIMEKEPFDSPLQPFGGMDEIAWTPDGSGIAYTCKKLTGKAAAFSTNSDIYLYDVDSKSTRNLTSPNKGYDRCPTFSPDGKYLFWLSMVRAGFEADRERLMMLDRGNGQVTEITAGFDHSVSNIRLSEDGKTIFFVAGVNGTYQLYSQRVENGKPEAITKGQHDYHSFELTNDWLIGTRVSMVDPAEIFRVARHSGEQTQLSKINTKTLQQLKMPTVKETWVTTTDNQKMLTWIVLPPDFDSLRSYPTLLYCEGGPQSAVSQFWSYRWNLSVMASQGYVVVAPNRRGTLTFGQSWTDQISKNHGKQEMKDLLRAIDVIAENAWVDKDNLGAIGASYGGYTVYWLAGHHEKRFKAFISHCGVFHSEMEYLTTEEMFFDEWEMGGKPWDKTNRIAQESFAQSPHLFVEKWDTPILIVHGGNDFRIPYTQGMAAFNAAKIRGVEAKFLFFPDESHWVLKPQNGLLWQREFFAWLDEHLKKTK